MQLEIDSTDPSMLLLHQAPYAQCTIDRFSEDMQKCKSASVPARHESINQDEPIDGSLTRVDLKLKTGHNRFGGQSYG